MIPLTERLPQFASLFAAFLLMELGTLPCRSLEEGDPAKDRDGQTLLSQGLDLARRGKFGQAIETWKRAEELFEQAKNRLGQARALLHVVTTSQNLGRRGCDVDKDLALCQSLAEQLHNPELTLAVQCALGAELLETNPARATVVLRDALEMAQKDGRTRDEALILNNLANSLAAQQNYEGAQTCYNQCANLANRTAQEELGVRALLNAAGVAKDAQDLSRADVLLQNGAGKLDGMIASHAVATLYLKAGQIQQAILQARLGNTTKIKVPSNPFASAKHFFERAYFVAAELDDQRSVSLALGNRGHLCEVQGQDNEALALTKRAIFAAQSCSALELVYRWEWQAGRIHNHVGSKQSALAAYRRAVTTIEGPELRHDILLATTRQGASGFRQYLGPMLYEFADLLLDAAEKAVDQRAVRGYLLESRNALELIKSAELDDYLQDPCQTLARMKISDAGAVSPRTAVIYPIVLSNRLELLVSFPGGALERVQTRVGAAQLEVAVRDLQDKLRTRTTYEFVGPARQLHHWLMDGLLPLLVARNTETLVFVPDGALRMIPMGALFDGTNFLARRFAIAITPGLTLMDPHAPNWKSPNLLLNGLSVGRPGFPPLPNVNREIQQVNRAFGGTVLTNQFFTAKRMTEEFARSQYSIVHFATHGRFVRDASKSFVLAYDGPLSLDQLENLIRPSQYRGRPVELLTLSACETAAGDDRAALGLAGVAIKAGARSALATLWSVHDEASARLISTFYAEFRRHPAVSKAKALQAAQLELMDDPNYRHPYYWSPFLVIGNWL